MSHLGPGNCELIFEVGNYRQFFCRHYSSTISFTIPESVLASDSSSESVLQRAHSLCWQPQQNRMPSAPLMMCWNELTSRLPCGMQWWRTWVVWVSAVTSLRCLLMYLWLLSLPRGSSQRDARSCPWKRLRWDWLGEWHVSDSDFHTGGGGQLGVDERDGAAKPCPGRNLDAVELCSGRIP